MGATPASKSTHVSPSLEDVPLYSLLKTSARRSSEAVLALRRTAKTLLSSAAVGSTLEGTPSADVLAASTGLPVPEGFAQARCQSRVADLHDLA